MHYLITGHTGFKGSWLSLMLEMQGHAISGIALDPPAKSLFNQAKLSTIFEYDLRLDIRDYSLLEKSVRNINPDIIIHLAAQPLVRESYRRPTETFDVNVMGTLNILEAMRGLQDLKAGLIITTDKVYKNKGHSRGYVETDELGGDDPYSASKAAADIATQSWIKSFAEVPIAIARAGNVIGGGDWAQDRIIPDLVNSYSSGQLPTLRFPDAIRPWQHVLDCLNGYLALIEFLLNKGTGIEWNFGPGLKDKYTVGQLANAFAGAWGIDGYKWDIESTQQLHESAFLMLDSSKARAQLTWKDNLNFEDTIKSTVDWYKSDFKNDAEGITREQIRDFLDIDARTELGT